MLSRRAILRTGLVGVLGLIRPVRPSGAGLLDGGARVPTAWAGPLTCDLSVATRRKTPPSLRGEPFDRPLPRPPVVGQSGLVTLTIGRADVELLPGVMTPMLTYDGGFPGPTIAATPGQPLELTVENGLDEGAVLHLHGVHASSLDDGHVRDVIPPGGARLYRYDNSQRPSTLWYHDHLLMRTADRIHRGLAGAYVIQDPADRDLGLPVGDDHDVVITLTDKTFADDGTLDREDGSHAPTLGDVVLVNGADRPRLDVAPGLLRLRIINASNARAFQLVRTDGEPLVQIASDGGLLAAPRERVGIQLGPAERVEVVLDLADVAVGTRVHLADAADEIEVGLLRIEVVSGDVSDGVLASSFSPLDALAVPEVTRTIELGLAPDGRFVLNGHGYAEDLRDVFARLGAVERWRLVNTTAVSHPMHLHLVSFLVRSRTHAQGGPQPLRAEDEGWKDVVMVGGFQTVEIDARFTDHQGDFMYHCHILEHEDHDMMSQFRVVDLARLAGSNRVQTSAAVAASLDPDGESGDGRHVVVAEGTDWRGALAGAALADALLLVGGSSLDPAVESELRRSPPARITVVGNVDPAVVSVLEDHGPTMLISGADDLDTVARVAEQLAGRSEVAVIATSEVFADSLAAGLLGVPILLTDPSSLSAPAQRALGTLGVREVVIAGGPAAVSAAVEAQLTALVDTVTRVAGPERTATAAAFTRLAGLSSTVYAASSTRFPDALGAALAARVTGAALVLLDDAGASPATAAVMRDGAVGRVLVVGGESAVPLAAEHALASLMQVNDGRP